ncbi:hypothetical protein [Rhizobium leguminosarum]|uniref:hypothetical protein n=1 Tax=Rhizobium leguminosarum TaxID=384 RepID=UPI0021BC0D79|nr:hypothetical protein [Rhizobium leguminosarum]
MTKTFLYYVLITSVALAINVKSVLAAEDSGSIAFNQMRRCLKLPADAPSAYSFLIVALIKNGSAAPLIADAITQCEPYSSVSGKMEFAVTREFVEAG